MEIKRPNGVHGRIRALRLNPRWVPLEWNGPSVVKAPASAANLGVRFLPHNEYIGYLQTIAPDLARFGVLEEFIDGPQYELDGYVVGGVIGCFHFLLQHWNEAGDTILGYERKNPATGESLEAALTAVRSMGIDDSPFCVEMRHDLRRGGWKIIEVHARLGEDPGLGELMSDEYPLNVIERACLSAIRDQENELPAYTDPLCRSPMPTPQRQAPSEIFRDGDGKVG